ncbi:NepR family anti-sigma factor [Sagittula sp. NFXS13]|uniref:NepR family anti-sigma factor n=1 Tax=Sagittula sp. NFXS13 TaxID=2819095 RepID=UPI0032DEC7B8
MQAEVWARETAGDAVRQPIFFGLQEQNSRIRVEFRNDGKSVQQMNSDRKTSKVQQEIDDNLKRAYGDVTKQDVPDRFTDLLAQLRAAEESGGPEGGDSNAES